MSSIYYYGNQAMLKSGNTPCATPIDKVTADHIKELEAFIEQLEGDLRRMAWAKDWFCKNGLKRIEQLEAKVEELEAEVSDLIDEKDTAILAYKERNKELEADKDEYRIKYLLMCGRN